MKDLVFVYGSLKRGYYGHHQMDGAVFAGAARSLLPCYRMVACPWPDAPHEAYPGVVVVPESDEGAGFISGEVYEASPDILVRLDAFEVEGRDYVRTQIDLGDGRRAWTYLSINLESQGAVMRHARIGFDPQDKVYTWLNTRG